MCVFPVALHFYCAVSQLWHRCRPGAVACPLRRSEAVDEIQVAEDAGAAIEVRLFVAGNVNAVDGGDPGAVGGANLFPARCADGGGINADDVPSGAGLHVAEDPAAVGAEAGEAPNAERVFEDGGRSATDGVDVDFLIGAEGGDGFAVGRNSVLTEFEFIASRGDGTGLVGSEMGDPEPPAGSGFVGVEDDAGAIGRPSGEGKVIEAGIGKRSRLSSLGGNDYEMGWSAAAKGDGALAVRFPNINGPIFGAAAVAVFGEEKSLSVRRDVIDFGGVEPGVVLFHGLSGHQAENGDAPDLPGDKRLAARGNVQQAKGGEGLLENFRFAIEGNRKERDAGISTHFEPELGGSGPGEAKVFQAIGAGDDAFFAGLVNDGQRPVAGHTLRTFGEGEPIAIGGESRLNEHVAGLVDCFPDWPFDFVFVTGAAGDDEFLAVSGPGCGVNVFGDYTLSAAEQRSAGEEAELEVRVVVRCDQEGELTLAGDGKDLGGGNGEGGDFGGIGAGSVNGAAEAFPIGCEDNGVAVGGAASGEPAAAGDHGRLGNGGVGTGAGKGAEREGEIAGGLESLVAIFFQSVQDDLTKPGGERGVQFRWIFAEDGGHGLGRSGARESLLVPDEFEEHGAEAEDVGTGVEFLAADLFGGHVGGGAHDDAGLGGAAGGERVVGNGFGLVEFDEAEIEDLGATVAGGPDVVGLDIAVGDEGGVGGGEAVGDLGGDVERGFQRKRDAVKRAAVDEFGDEVVFTDIVDGDDVGMVERGDDLRFLFEALLAVRVSREFGGKDFEGDVAIEAGVGGFIDLAHAFRRGRV